MTCARCHRDLCNHSDAEYAGVVSNSARTGRLPQATAGVSRLAGEVGGGATCPAPASKIIPVHIDTVTMEAAR